MANTGKSISKIIAATAVLSAFVVITVSATGREDPTQQTQDDLCENAVWPMIPATCLGRQLAEVGYPQEPSGVGGEPVSAGQHVMELGSRAPSEKADRLEPAEIGGAEYRTVETRTNRSSILTRIRIAD
jgi:hypothetical protein